MRFLILTQYYPPETGAPQNRLSSLAEHLLKLGNEVTVITAVPNYPKMIIFPEFKGKLYSRKIENGVTVKRVWIFTKYSSSKFIRLLNYLSFCFTSFFAALVSSLNNTIIICESPPLFLGITAVIVSKLTGGVLVFNVSDLWPESVEKVGLLTNKTALKILYKVEKWIYRESDLLSGQTQGIVEELRKHKSSVKVFWLKNGIDTDYILNTRIDSEWRKKNNYSNDDFIIMYGGVIGFAQALHTILEAAAILKNQTNIKFILIGDGPEKERLLTIKEELSLDNVHFIPNTPKEEMVSILNASDTSVIPLKNIEHFLGAIPSKIFEALAYRKPILLGVNGEARDLFIEKGNCGLYFEPENAIELADKILILYNNLELRSQLGNNGESYVKENFDRKIIAEDFMEFCKSNPND